MPPDYFTNTEQVRPSVNVTNMNFREAHCSNIVRGIGWPDSWFSLYRLVNVDLLFSLGRKALGTSILNSPYIVERHLIRGKIAIVVNI